MCDARVEGSFEEFYANDERISIRYIAARLESDLHSFARTKGAFIYTHACAQQWGFMSIDMQVDEFSKVPRGGEPLWAL